MKNWLKVHARQLATLVLWAAAMIALYKQPLWKDQIVVIAGALQLVGMQLPPFTLKGGAAAVKPLIGGMLLLVVFVVGPLLAFSSCAAIAKTEYGAQLQACVDKASTRAEADTCIHKIQVSWDEAGAPHAVSTVAVPFDGGKVIGQ